MSAKNISLSNCDWSVILSSKNSVPWKGEVVRLNCINAFPWDKHQASICSIRPQSVLPVLSHRIPQRQFNKVIKIFNSLLKVLKNLTVRGAEGCNGYWHNFVTVLVPVKMPAVLPTKFFCTNSANVHRMGKANSI